MVVVTGYTNTKPSVDTEVVVEPRLPIEPGFSPFNSPSVYEQIMIARTVAAWRANDGVVDVQAANSSSEHVALSAELVLGSLSPVVTTTV